MITDINGNMFSNLGNNSPVRTFGPKELFGSNIEIHVDATNPRDIFSDTGGTINVNTTGTTVINRLNDISGNNRHFYNYSGTAQSQANAIYNLTSGSSVFSANTLDTNKGKVLRDPNINAAVGLLSPMSPGVGGAVGSYTIAPTSSLTVCTYINVTSNPQAGGFANQFGINYTSSIGTYNFSLGQESNGGTSLVAWLKNTPYTILNNMTQYFGSYNMYTLTLSGYNFSVYINNTFITSRTVTSPSTFYPLGSITNFNYNSFVFNAMMFSTGINKLPYSVAESFITRECASPEKIALLYEYFRRKYKV
jgi:hypothetical protein